MSLDDNAKTVTVDGDTVNLTPLEYDILRLLMQHPGKVFRPTRSIAGCGTEDPAADNPVAVHVRHIREKIEINPQSPVSEGGVGQGQNGKWRRNERGAEKPGAKAVAFC